MVHKPAQFGQQRPGRPSTSSISKRADAQVHQKPEKEVGGLSSLARPAQGVIVIARENRVGPVTYTP